MELLKQSMDLEIQRGSLIPTIAISRILNGKNMIEALEKNDLKSTIYEFMEGREKTTISDIVEKFNLDAEKAIKLLEEMENEGRIRQN